MIIDGKAIADDLLSKYKSEVGSIRGRRPRLAVILIGKNPASHVYVNLKTKACSEVGIISEKMEFPDTFTQVELIELVEGLNRDPGIDGILVQMPLPPHINPLAVTLAIDPNKDIDGFHPINVGKLILGDKTGFVPCTPLGVMELLKYKKVSIPGKEAVIVGRSNIVGKPMAVLLLAEDATVTTVHSKTTRLDEICSKADILVAAVGKPHFIKAHMIKPGAVVIDVGINKLEDHSVKKGYRLVGDVDFETVSKKASIITPVPGGVGPMTIAMLIHNTLRSYHRRCEKPS